MAIISLVKDTSALGETTKEAVNTGHPQSLKSFAFQHYFSAHVFSLKTQ